MINDFTCELCLSKDKGAFYRCLECSWSKHGNFHVKCSFLQNKVKHKSHACDLTLLDSVREVIKGHDAAEYRCDICEKLGNSRHHVYDSEKCNFIAHIEWVICKVYLHWKSFWNKNKKKRNLINVPLSDLYINI